MMMIDTLMALWNQDRRKRALQVVFTFFLMCISISLLFVLTGRTTQPQSQRAGVDTATVPSFGNTVIPNLTPTLSVVVGMQSTPVPTIPPTPAPTSQVPCATTPSSSTGNQPSSFANIQQGPSVTPADTTTPTNTGTPYTPKKHNDGGGGGGPLPGVTPTFAAPGTPPVQSTVPAGNQPSGGFGGSNCATSNSVLNGTGGSAFAIVVANTWFILGGSLLGTTLFYGIMFCVKRRMRTL